MDSAELRIVISDAPGQTAAPGTPAPAGTPQPAGAPSPPVPGPVPPPRAPDPSPGLGRPAPGAPAFDPAAEARKVALIQRAMKQGAAPETSAKERMERQQIAESERRAFDPAYGARRLMEEQAAPRQVPQFAPPTVTAPIQPAVVPTAPVFDPATAARQRMERERAFFQPTEPTPEETYRPPGPTLGPAAARRQMDRERAFFPEAEQREREEVYEAPSPSAVPRRVEPITARDVQERRRLGERRASAEEAYEPPAPVEPIEAMPTYVPREAPLLARKAMEGPELPEEGFEDEEASRQQWAEGRQRAAREERRRKQDEALLRREDPAFAARKEMEEREKRKAFRESVESERAKIDPEFNAKTMMEKVGDVGEGVSQAGQVAAGFAGGTGGKGLMAAADAAASGLLMLGPVGMAAGAALKIASTSAKAFTGAVDAFTTRARELSGYSGRIAEAEAISDVRTLLRDVREAQQLQSGYADLLKASSQTQDALAQALLPIKRELLDALTALLSVVSEQLETMRGQWETIKGMVPGLKEIEESVSDKDRQSLWKGFFGGGVGNALELLNIFFGKKKHADREQSAIDEAAIDLRAHTLGDDLLSLIEEANLGNAGNAPLPPNQGGLNIPVIERGGF